MEGLQVKLGHLFSGQAASRILGILTLLAAEAAWGAHSLERVTEVTAAVIREYEPHYVIDARGGVSGFAVDVMNAVAQRAAVKIKYQVYDTLEQAVHALGAGQVDLIPNIGMTSSRWRVGIPSTPYETLRIAIFIRAGQRPVAGLSDLNRRDVGVVRMSTAAEVLRDRGISARQYPTLAEAVRALLESEIEILCYPSEPVRRIAQDWGQLHKIEVTGPPIEDTTRVVLFGAHRAALFAQLDPVLREFAASAQFDELHRRWFAPDAVWSEKSWADMNANARHLEQRYQHLRDIKYPFTQPTAKEREVLEDLKNGLGVVRYVSAYDQRYATHGTACAGLVCGTTDNADRFGNQGDIAVYYGVDPYSKIVPIVTSISPDPVQLIAAFLYALHCKVDVILFPRDVADPTRLPCYDKLDDEEKTRLEKDRGTAAAWKLLEKVIVGVSKKIPIVCAAGNDGRNELLYPASLAAEDDYKRPKNGVISVGAVSYAGYRSGYSSYSKDRHLTVVAPSDDGEVYNRHQIRIDKKAPEFADFWLQGVHSPDIPEVQFSAERLTSLDVPGPRGYAGGSRRRPIGNRAEAVDDPGSLYTGFGGTSGAAALVAGVIALMQRHNGLKLTGPEVKKRLTAAPPNLDIAHWYWLEGNRTSLETDAINGEVIPNPKALFGQGGLVSVPKLLGIDWSDI